MSKQRTQTPNKELLLKTVQANPGLSMSQLVTLTGVPVWTVQRILPELAGRRLIYYEIDKTDRIRRKRWYPLVGTDSLNSGPLLSTEGMTYTVLRQFVRERVIGIN